jgi:fructose-bisphosphate aldolase class 1
LTRKTLIMTEKKYTDIEKLQTLLTHWLQHNQDHGKEYAKWSVVARQAGNPTAAACIEQAVELLAKADKAFAQALEAVGGPREEHSPHGHGHHHHG